MTTNSSPTVQYLELLAPAKNKETAIAAIDHGADAVYIGAPSHGARRQAANTLEDIKEVVTYAHRFNVRVYVTVNTIVYDNELADVCELVWNLYSAGVDALIVQDMSLLRMNLPPIALHASTQCDIRTPSKARFLQDAGFSQLVLPRELSLDEIRAFSNAVDIPLEAFVHGALCVSYSGDCQASFLTTGRSANRGECAQICRYKFNLEDSRGNRLIEGKHLLSLKDMNRLDMLQDMADAGISSFKIEGRLKDIGYVKNVVAAYSDALNRIVAASDGKYRRRSRGTCEVTFTPDVTRSFNRGFTSYFLKDIHPGAHALASIDSPKWIGANVGVVKRQLSPRRVKAVLSCKLENGDGLGYFNGDGEFCGFRLNKIEGDIISTASDVAVPAGTQLYRNFDKQWNAALDKPTSRRTIGVNMSLRSCGDTLVLELTDNDGVNVAVSQIYAAEPAATPQTEARKRVLSKLGDTIFSLQALDDGVGSLFIPASVLTSLRRDGVDAMLHANESAYSFDYRRKADSQLSLPEGVTLSRHDNIANHEAATFYESIGCTVPKAAKAVETMKDDGTEMRVMQTRYCLRRELGACLKQGGAKKVPGQLFLTSGPDLRFRLDFDCANCRMNVIRVAR